MRRFWIWFHKKYGKACGKLSASMKYYGDFSAHYFLHDENGDVKDVAKNIFEAIKKHKTTGLYVARIHETR